MARAGVLFSGGKDSTYAAWLASKNQDLACLITLFPKSQMSYMFHFPNLRWTGLQAEAMGVPQLTRTTEGVKEEELADLRAALEAASKQYHLDVIYTGALASVYQKTRVEGACKELGLKCMSPLWGMDPEEHLRNLVDNGFTVMVVSVSALGLERDWLGRVIDHKAIDELVALGHRYRFHVGLEGGEGETLVLDAPLFKRRLVVDDSSVDWRGDSGYLEIKGAHLEARAAGKA